MNEGSGDVGSALRKAPLTVGAMRIGYGERVVLATPEIEIAEGRLIGVLGANGSGKSTFLRTLAGLLPPLDGRAPFDDLPISSRVREVAYLPQEESSAFPLTVGELVEIGLVAHRSAWSVNDTERLIISEALEAVGLQAKVDTPVDRLSGGQRRRASIARCLAQRADVMILDEPISSLDVSHAVEVMKLLQRLSRGMRSIILSIHDIDLASEWCDDLLVVGEGELLFRGSPAELTSDVLERAYGTRMIRAESWRAVPHL